MDNGSETELREEINRLKRELEECKRSATLFKNQYSYEQIFNTLPVVAFVVSVDDEQTFRIIAVNQMQCEILGKTCEEINGKLISEIIPEEHFAKVKEKYLQCIESGKIIEYEEYVPLPWNKYFYTTITPILNEDNRVEYLCGITRDITYLKNLEINVLKKDFSFKTLIANLPDVVVVHKHGKIVYINEAITRITGYKPDELLGKSIMDYLGIEESKMVLKKESLRIGSQKIPEVYEIKINPKNNKTRIVEVRSLEIEYEGEKSRLVVLTDITDKKFTEEKFRLLVENSYDLICELDKNFNYTFISKNYETLFGYNPEELIGKNPLDKIHDDDKSVVQEKMINALKGEYLSTVSFRHRKKSGGWCWVESVGQAFFTPENELRAVVVTRDISERIESEKKIKNQFDEMFAIFNSIDGAVIVTDLISNEILAVNKFAEDIYGEDIVGKNSNDFVRIHNAILCPECPDKQLVNNKGEPTGSIIREYQTNDGKWYQCIEKALQWPNGHTARLEISIDISASKKTVEQLRQSEERFKNLADMLPETIYETDVDGKFVYVNKVGLQTFGYTLSDLKKGFYVTDLFADEEKKKILENRMLTMTTTKSRRIEFTGIDKSGKKIPIIIHSVPIVLNGAVEGTRGIVIDISERKKNEESLLLNENRLETLLAVTKMVDADNDHIIHFVLEEGVRLTKSAYGYIAFIDEDEEKIKMLVWSKNIQGNREKKDLSGKKIDSKMGMLDETIKKRSPLIINNSMQLLKYGVVIPDGHIDIQKYMTTPLFENGKIVAVVGVANKTEDYNESDVIQLTLLMNEMYRIIQHKNNLRIINREKEKLSITLRSISDAVIVTDVKGLIQYCNNAAEILLDVTGKDIMDKHINGIMHLYQKNGEPVNDLLEFGNESSGVTLPEDLLLLDNSNFQKHIEGDVTKINDLYNQISGYVIILRDVSEKKRIEEERLRTIKLDSVGILAGGIAHDFNNILTAILGNISLARFILKGEDHVQTILLEAEKASDRAKGLTHQLLTLSKGGSPVKMDTSIEQLIRDTAEFVLRGSNVSCEFNIPKDFPNIEIDEGQINQVLNNLIINAVQSMPSGGKIIISGDIVMVGEGNPYYLNNGKYIKIAIRDFGSGIPPENIPKIFDPYFTTKETGHGLGLATSYSIIKNHGGHIEVESTLNNGTAFTFYLPAKCSGKNEVMPESYSINENLNIRILVLEDEENITTFLKEFFIQFNYKADFTNEGSKTVKLYKEAMKSQKYDIVMLDLTIPGGQGGKDTMAELLKIDKSVKGIVCSGYSNDSIMADYRHYGFQACMVKPYQIENLNKTIQSVIKN